MNIVHRSMSGYYTETECHLPDFEALVSRTAVPEDVPLATSIQSNVPIYDMAVLRAELEVPERRRRLMAEWAAVLREGAGVLVLKAAYADTAPVDAATEVYNAIIAKEKADKGDGADHFAKAGSNDRIWNSLQKLCLNAPEVFMAYFSNPAIDAACEAWLGPNYQMTAQVNVVRTGGAAQQAHRDYHLGFQTAEVSATYPAHVHELSPLLTLQGGIAHCDMPVESGPTKLLPFSQAYKPGYAAWRRDDFRACFEARFVQIPLEKGDALCFNPALFHAAGDNRSTYIHRMANLLQISSAFGCAMETIDRAAMCRAIYEPVLARWTSDELSEAALDALIASTGQGYSFPTNLDNDPPVGGLAPQTQQALLKECILSGTSASDFAAQLAAQRDRQLA